MGRSSCFIVDLHTAWHRWSQSCISRWSQGKPIHHYAELMSLIPANAPRKYSRGLNLLGSLAGAPLLPITSLDNKQGLFSTSIHTTLGRQYPSVHPLLSSLLLHPRRLQTAILSPILPTTRLRSSREGVLPVDLRRQIANSRKALATSHSRDSVKAAALEAVALS